MPIISYLRKLFGLRVSVSNELDPRIEALFADIVQRFPPFTPYEGPIDAEYSIRPSIARKLTRLSRDGMIIGLGCYVSDVRGTIEKALSLMKAGEIHEAQEQLRAQVGRIASNDFWGFSDPRHAYYQHHGPPAQR